MYSTWIRLLKASANALSVGSPGRDKANINPP